MKQSCHSSQNSQNSLFIYLKVYIKRGGQNSRAAGMPARWPLSLRPDMGGRLGTVGQKRTGPRARGHAFSL